MAGANNAGKSNLVDAIRMFYGDNIKWVDSRDKPLAGKDDGESWVEIEFAPTSEELETLKEEYKSGRGTFRVRNYFRSASKDSEGKIKSGFYGYENGELSQSPFYGFRNVGAGKFGTIVYIPAVSKIDEHTKLTGPSPLRDLVANVLKKAVASSKAYADLTASFERFEKEIKTETSEEGQSLKSVEDDLSREIKAWEVSFGLGIQTVQPDDMVKSLIQPELFDLTHGKKIDQAQFGAGFQRHLVYSLIKLAAQYSGSVPKKKSTVDIFAPELTWILFEEPEAFLHPSQEDELYRSLLTVVKDENSQVLITTHSARFVSHSMDHLTRLIRLRRDSAVTTCYQLSELELDELFHEAHLADSEITPEIMGSGVVERQKLMSAMKLELWIQPHRAAAFFSKRAVIVEGPSEVGLYSYLISRGHMSADSPGIVVVDSIGKYNIHRFMRMFDKFGIDHAVLYDGDGGGSKDTEVTKTIQESSGRFTKHVHRLEKDIETLLCIEPLPKNEVKKGRKPQYILYNLEAGLVPANGVEAAVSCFRTVCETA